MTDTLSVAGVLLLVGCMVQSRPVADKVKSWPNWDAALPSDMYSGFINSTHSAKYGQLHSHYLFVECETDPATAPLLVWYNGGPGASSLFGMMIELGPFMFNDESLATADYKRNGIPSPVANPYAWSKVANVLAISAPPPVGFSWCDAGGPGGDGYSCGDWDDDRTAAANDASLRSWVSAFPEFAQAEMYVFGESYAGIYVPTLVRSILANNEAGATPRLNIHGFGIGDGCIGHEDMPHSFRTLFDVEFMRGHGQFSMKLAREIDTACDWSAAEAARRPAHGGGALPVGTQCAALLDQMYREVGGYYSYNLYDECTYENVIGGVPRRRAARRARPYEVDAAAGTVTLKAPEQHTWALGAALNDYACGGPGVMKQYLNHSAVKAALNLPPNAVFFQCDNGEGFNYTGNTPALMPFYRHVIENTTLRVLVYNGDTDPGLNSFYAQNWTAALGYKERQAWRPWTLDARQRMGGYVTRYENDFDFVTIRGAGHMVPEYKSAASLEFASRWLLNEDFKPYKDDDDVIA
eukprot:g1481.t1